MQSWKNSGSQIITDFDHRFELIFMMTLIFIRYDLCNHKNHSKSVIIFLSDTICEIIKIILNL